MEHLSLNSKLLGWTALLLLPAAHCVAQSSGAASAAAASAIQAGVAGPSPGSIAGVVKDKTGALVGGANVVLRSGLTTLNLTSQPDGTFAFASVPPGPFRLTVTDARFQPAMVNGLIHPGERIANENVVLSLQHATADVQVFAKESDVAAAQVHLQEQQRVLGVFPNFYVSYVPHPAPLTAKQKFQLALRSSVDPVTIGFAGALAGLGQAEDNLSGYGQGAQGYGKRFGAQYADTVSGNFLAGAAFASLFRQDPRYFWKGSGTAPSRFLWAVKQTIICRGDNGKWQPNISSFAGNLTAAGIANFYYPDTDRKGFGLIATNFATGYAYGAVGNLVQEFLLHHFTPKVPDYKALTPPGQTSPKR